MRGSAHDTIEQLKNKLSACRRRFAEAGSLRTGLPFLGLTAVVLSGALLASSCTLCYRVEAQGQSVTYFQGETTYSQAVSMAESKASQILDTDYAFTEELVLKTTLAPKTRLEDPQQAADSLMGIIPELEHVYTLWVDGALVGAAEDSETIHQALTLVKDHYATPDTRSILVDSQVNLRYEYVSADTGTLDAQGLAELLLEEIPQQFPYTVQPGDTLEGLLDRFTMTLERLQELNPEVTLEPSVLGTGLEMTAEEATQEELADLAELWAAQYGTPLETDLVLTIEQTCPRLVVSTVEEQTLTRPLAPQLQTQPDPTMFTGEQRIVQEGQAGEEAVLARVVKRCGVTVASNDLSAVTTTEATPLIVGTGTQAMPQLPEGCLFLWPVRGPITSDYGYRFIFGETDFHRGVDLAAPMGTAINAAADGVVVFAGERGTYGNLVILSHQNGFMTYYAHCSKLLVSPGDVITQGQPVAAVGSTGRSTGPHLHFEVRYQNSPIDPLLYLPGDNNAPARTEITEDEAEEETLPPEAQAPAVTPETPAAPEEGLTPGGAETPAVPQAPQDPAAPEAPLPQPETPAESPDPAKVPDPQTLETE